MRRIMVLAVALLLLFSPYLTTLKAADSATSSVPDFTVHYACDGWGYPWESKTLTVTIQNPPFTANQTSNSELVYSVRCKGHFEDWGSSGGHGVN
jgi:hypothetical protein